KTALYLALKQKTNGLMAKYKIHGMFIENRFYNAFCSAYNFSKQIMGRIKMKYDNQQKKLYAEKFSNIDRTIYGGYNWQYRYKLGKMLDALSQRKLIKDFQRHFDNVPDNADAAQLNRLLESVKSQYRVFVYNQNENEAWALIKG
ncbi:hypothetical protein, partial [Rummeliibacillus stabekisii]|uniref:hypothetical protein n=1 Tax=Rummeliibacillus stabekisii TaxID=241244 RepID=UPI00371C21EA